MWKFKPSKYKNAAAKIPKREECILDISASNIGSSCGNHIKASAAYVAFNIDQAGGSALGILPVDAKGRFSGTNLPTVQAHSDFVTDFDFSPFDDFLLATCSQDFSTKIWHLPSDLRSGTICNPSCILTQQDKRIENVTWNPVAENILALTVGQSAKIFDVSKQMSCMELDSHTDQIQSLSWKGVGSLMATSSRDKTIRIFDVRASEKEQAVASGHQNNKDSRVLWLGDTNFLLSTGFNAARQREVVLRDFRKLSESLKTLSLDSSTGVLMPFFDADTSMIFLAGKGDTTIRFLELADREPQLIENSAETVEQIKGLAVLPKRAVDVMKCEVDRLLVLAQQSIIPMSYVVPRKSYREFHSDLFPDTFSGIPPLDSVRWLNGQTEQPTAVSLDPSKKCKLILRRKFGSESETEFPGELSKNPKQSQSVRPAVSASDTPTQPADDDLLTNGRTNASLTENVLADGSKDRAADKSGPEKSTIAPGDQGAGDLRKAAKVLTGVRQSKFKNLEGSLLHKSTNIENIRNVSKSIPGESDFFHANRTFCAVPIGGAGGLIAILQTEKKGRLPDGSLPALQNGSLVTDFVWDPFNDHRLAVGCDDAKIRIWNIPHGGLTETIDSPSGQLRGHTEKVYFVRFHPSAAGLLASGSYDMTVRLWDINSEQEIIKLNGHTDSIFSFAWSMDGQRCATSCKDGKIRIYDPRSSVDPLSVGVGLEGSRGGRCIWTCNDRLLIVTGFDRASMRQVAAYDATNLSSALYKIDLETAPSILVPHYDPDSSTIFLSGRGDSAVRAYEVAEDHPYLFSLSDYKADGPHQSLSFLPKSEVDVRKVEFAKALRLTANSIEALSFKVPRTRTAYFQDDLFPDTRVTWESALDASEWFEGLNRIQPTISLKPAGMKSLSEAPTEAPKQQKYESFESYKANYKTDEQKKEELLKAMTSKLCLDESPLPQDQFEGVDPDEWDEDS